MNFHNFYLTTGQLWDNGPRILSPKRESVVCWPSSFRLYLLKWAICWSWASTTRSWYYSTEKMLCRKIPNELHQLESSVCCQKSVLSLSLIWVVFSSQRRKSSLTHMWKPPSQMAEAEQKNVFGSFSDGGNHTFIPLHNQDSNSPGEQCHWGREGSSISDCTWNKGNQKNEEQVLEVAWSQI